MTDQETIKVVTLIVMSYPAAEKFKDENTIKAMVSVWKQIFRDDNARLVELAVQKHIATNKWPPNIAEIREQMVAIEHPEIIPPDIAWAAVSDVLNTSGSAYAPALPPLIKRCVEIIGWDQLKEMWRGQFGGSKPGMDRVMFLQQYTPMYEREREKAMLPKALNNAIRQAEKSNEAYGLLDAVHQARVVEQDMWDQAMKNNYERLLEKSERRLLGDSENA